MRPFYPNPHSGTSHLPNRISGPSNSLARHPFPTTIQTPLLVDYYHQRATARSSPPEGTPIDPLGVGLRQRSRPCRNNKPQAGKPIQPRRPQKRWRPHLPQRSGTSAASPGTPAESSTAQLPSHPGAIRSNRHRQPPPPDNALAHSRALKIVTRSKASSKLPPRAHKTTLSADSTASNSTEPTGYI